MKLVCYSSIFTMMHGPIYIRFKCVFLYNMVFLKMVSIRKKHVDLICVDKL